MPAVLFFCLSGAHRCSLSLATVAPPCGIGPCRLGSARSAALPENGVRGSLERHGTGLYYANGMRYEEEEEEQANGGEPPMPAARQQANGHSHGWQPDGSGFGSGGAGRAPPRGKQGGARLSPPQPHHPQQNGDSEAMYSDGSGLPGDGQLRLVHEVSESDVGALAGGSGQRGAHIYAGPADRANQAAAGYLRNQSFSFPSMLGTPASPAQQQLMQTAPRVRA